MRQADTFWALLRVALAIGSKVWHPRAIEVRRSVRLRLQGNSHRLTQVVRLMQGDGRRPGVRMTFSLSGAPSKRAERLLVDLGRAVLGASAKVTARDTTIWVGGPLRRSTHIDPAWRAVRSGLRTGTPARRASGTSERWSEPRTRRLIARLLREGPDTWTPEYACLRQVRHFSAVGYRWTAFLDGLWNQWDQTFAVWVQSRDNLTSKDWRTIKASGFVEGLATRLEEGGLRIDVRARFEGLPRRAHTPRVFFELSKPVHRAGLLREARSFLAWSFRAPLPQPSSPRSAFQLFLPERQGGRR